MMCWSGDASTYFANAVAFFFFACAVVVALLTQKIYLGLGTRVIRRGKSPKLYWILVCLFVMAGAWSGRAFFNQTTSIDCINDLKNLIKIGG